MSGSVLRGTAAVFGDFVAADVILPARFAFLPTAEAVPHAMAELAPDANARLRAHPILVGGNAFGYGSGREATARVIKAAGVKAVIGGPFARMFFRNAINNGVLVIDCPALIAAGIADGDAVTIDLDACTAVTASGCFAIAPTPPIIRSILAAGSIVDYGRALLAARA
ncbi:MAG: 3-isopropylmalate dehydratase small subunit [Alphaproteobacteria bacterium]|nr:3-isopropylmalate dehydratase small subunit [Alphaproteobacteria bacterium]